MAATAVAAMVFLTGVGGGSEPRPLATCGRVLSLEHPEVFKGFKLYALGCGWRGLALDDVVYTRRPAPPLYYHGWKGPRELT